MDKLFALLQQPGLKNGEKTFSLKLSENEIGAVANATAPLHIQVAYFSPSSSKLNVESTSTNSSGNTLLVNILK